MMNYCEGDAGEEKVQWTFSPPDGRTGMCDPDRRAAHGFQKANLSRLGFDMSQERISSTKRSTAVSRIAESCLPRVAVPRGFPDAVDCRACA